MSEEICIGGCIPDPMKGSKPPYEKGMMVKFLFGDIGADDRAAGKKSMAAREDSPNHC